MFIAMSLMPGLGAYRTTLEYTPRRAISLLERRLMPFDFKFPAPFSPLLVDLSLTCGVVATKLVNDKCFLNRLSHEFAFLRLLICSGSKNVSRGSVTILDLSSVL